MTNTDTRQEKLSNIRTRMSAAIKENDDKALEIVLTDYGKMISEEILSKVDNTVDFIDSSILAARNIRQLTSQEKSYYNKFIEAGKSADPRSAIANIEEDFPKTTINEVLDDIRHDHPLLDVIDFHNTSAITRWVYNTQPEQTAVWGELTSAITKELEGSIGVLEMTQCKLSAFMYIAQDLLDLGPNWIDLYIRNTLYEAISVGASTGIIDGTGKSMPIGMTRDLDGAVVSGEYPRKTAIEITDLSPKTYGDLLSTLAVDPRGYQRPVVNPIFAVNPADYFKIVFPATTILTPGGGYAKDVLPYPTRIIQDTGVPSGHAVMGIPRLYFMGIGLAKGGRIETSDEYKFLEDMRTYKIRFLGNGRPKDNKAFMLLDISKLEPTYPTVNTYKLGE